MNTVTKRKRKTRVKTIPGHIVDAAEMHRLHPKTFEVPDQDELDSLQAGDLIKICVEPPDDMPPERFWLKVTEADGIGDDMKITGEVSNDLWFVDLDIGDVLTVGQRHIYAIEMQ